MRKGEKEKRRREENKKRVTEEKKGNIEKENGAYTRYGKMTKRQIFVVPRSSE